MKYATIESGKIIKVNIGVRPSGGVNVIQKWSLPTEFPDFFYMSKTSSPILSIVGEEVHENMDIIIKPLELIKRNIYAQQKTVRQQKQLGSFDFGGTEIVLKDREDSLFIASLDPDVPLRMKIASKEKGGRPIRVDLDSAQIKALKATHQAHVQAAYTWEEDQNAVVESFTTHEELAEYLLTLTGE